MEKESKPLFSLSAVTLQFRCGGGGPLLCLLPEGVAAAEGALLCLLPGVSLWRGAALPWLMLQGAAVEGALLCLLPEGGGRCSVFCPAFRCVGGLLCLLPGI